MKKQRIIDLELIHCVKMLPCTACNKIPSDAHHITTRAAGGSDIDDNLIPLCREHHTQWHQQGSVAMVKSFKPIERWLIQHNRIDILNRAHK